MKRFFASIVITIAIICGYLTPAYAGGSPITGYSALIAGAFAILLVLFGAGIYSVSRKDN